MTTQRKDEAIYVALAFFTSIGQLTWVQMAYNEPTTLRSMDWRSLATLLSISAVFVLTQTLIAWKAFGHDPNKAQNSVLQTFSSDELKAVRLLLTAPPGEVPPKPIETLKPEEPKPQTEGTK